MKIDSLLPLVGRLVGVLAIAASAAAPAAAATVWTDWTSATNGAPGSATGTVSGVGVTYTGELDGAIINGSSTIWNPASSFVGGTVTASPATVGDDLRLNGDFTGTNTITFATPVVDPVFAIWSLGQPGLAASFFFFQALPTLQAGGLNSQFGGSALTIDGSTVSGIEGNGVIQFNGTISSISWTNSFENFYAFTVGVNGLPGPGGQVPEPATATLLLAGLALALLSVRRPRRSRPR